MKEQRSQRDELEKLSEQMIVVAPRTSLPVWELPLWMSFEDSLGGIFTTSVLLPKTPMDDVTLDEFVTLWQQDEPLTTFEVFYEQFQDTVCSDWYKSDMSGKSQEWQRMPPPLQDDKGHEPLSVDANLEEEEGEEENYTDMERGMREWDLCAWRNARHLAQLPFPPTVLLRAVQHMCLYRREEVTDVHTLLCWVQDAAYLRRAIDLPRATPLLQPADTPHDDDD